MTILVGHEIACKRRRIHVVCSSIYFRNIFVICSVFLVMLTLVSLIIIMIMMMMIMIIIIIIIIIIST